MLDRNKKGQFVEGHKSLFSWHGKEFSEEHKLNIGKSGIGRIPWNKGKHHSEEHKLKLKKAWIKRCEVPISQATKEKISKTCKERGIGKWMVGRTNNYAKLKVWKELNGPWNKGKKFPQFSGKNSPVWKGGYENKLMHNKKRRMLKSGIDGTHTLEQWQELKKKYNYMCLCCKQQEPFITLSEDHIIPISLGGSDNIQNIQPLCRSCNSRKFNKVIDFLKEYAY